jgi:hypothetical protein
LGTGNAQIFYGWYLVAYIIGERIYQLGSLKV